MVVVIHLTLSGEHMMQYVDNILESCILETSMVSLTSVTPINSIIFLNRLLSGSMRFIPALLNTQLNFHKYLILQNLKIPFYI